MKKLNLWLLASLFVAAFTLSACGSDDDDNTGGGPMPDGVVGKWVGEWAANPNSNDQLMWRYAHKLYYTLSSNNTIELLESACWYTNESDMKQYDKPSISIDPARPNGYYLGERIVHRMAGTYSLSGNKITLNFDKEGWGSNEQVQMQDLGEYGFKQTYDYKISGNKLQVGDGSLVPASPHNLVIYDWMTYQGK
jgi:hypothetical protein